MDSRKQAIMRRISIDRLAPFVWIVLASFQGCARDPVGKPLDDPDAERTRLGHTLTHEKLNRDDQYIVRVRLAESETRSLGKGVPSYYKYASVVHLMPDRPEAKVSFARMVVAMLDRQGSYVVGGSPQSLEQAAIWMSQVIARDPNNAEYYMLRSRCYVAEHSREERARADMERAAALAPNNPRVWVEQGRALVACRDYAAAAPVLQRAIAAPSIDPVERSTAHALLGRSAQLQKQGEASATEFDAALKDNSDNLDAIYGKGMYDWARRSPRFDDMVDRARALNKDCVLARFYDGLHRMGSDHSGDHDWALAWMHRCAEADPANPAFGKMIDLINARVVAQNERVREIREEFLGLAATGLGAAVAHDLYMNNLPKLDEVNKGKYVAFGEHVIIEYRNSRGPGKVWIHFTQGGQEWKRIFHVEGLEQREYEFKLPGFQDSGKLHVELDAVQKVSPADLEGAVEQ